MGILYKIEALTLLEDVKQHEYITMEDFLKKTRNNYHATARNCWIAAVIYLVMIALSYLCIVKARQSARRMAKEEDDDEIFCSPNPVKKKQKNKGNRDEEDAIG